MDTDSVCPPSVPQLALPATRILPDPRIVIPDTISKFEETVISVVLFKVREPEAPKANFNLVNAMVPDQVLAGTVHVLGVDAGIKYRLPDVAVIFPDVLVIGVALVEVNCKVPPVNCKEPVPVRATAPVAPVISNVLLAGIARFPVVIVSVVILRLIFPPSVTVCPDVALIITVVGPAAGHSRVVVANAPVFVYLSVPPADHVIAYTCAVPTVVKFPPIISVPATDKPAEGNCEIVLLPELPVIVNVPPEFTVIEAGWHACPVSVYVTAPPLATTT